MNVRAHYFFKKPITPAIYAALFISAFLVRITVFYCYIQHEERYCQPDTQGYTVPALALNRGMGMYIPGGFPAPAKPVFWRTPGYSLLLAPFYSLSDAYSWDFQDHAFAHKTAVVFQIAWCSLLPILLYVLAYLLTTSLTISYILAVVGVVHPGAVLASTFLLTDAPAQIFFTLFLISICSLLFLRLPPKKAYRYLFFAALALSAYTWMRPMGQFVALATLSIIALAPLYLFKQKIQHILFFITIFALTLAPWFVRNYSLTGKLFFCPLFGLYFNVFNAPKIRARVEKIPHELAWKIQCHEAEQEIIKEYQKAALRPTQKVIVHENICMRPALPWLLQYPHYALYDWIVEVCKTTFDLYMYQCVSLHHNTFKWDPLVEYLGDKLAETLYTKELPWYMRLIAYLECFTSVLLWIGIAAGCVALATKRGRRTLLLLLTTCGIFIASVVGQSGGFGYARLRLPVEPLIIIAGIACWIYLYKTYIKKIE